MIPWSLLLRHSPLILAGADALLARSKSRGAEPGTPAHEERLRKLEDTSTESAQLLHDIARQLDALSAVQKTTAKRAQLAVVLSVVAVTLALSACVLILLS